MSPPPQRLSLAAGLEVGQETCHRRCIVAVVESDTVELRCNKCGAVVGVVQVGIMEGLLGLDCDEEP